MHKLWTIITQTYSRQVKSWSFLVFIITPFVFALIVGAISYFSGKSADSNNTNKIAVISTQKPLRKAFIKQNKNMVKDNLTSKNSAQKSLSADNIFGYLQLKVKENKVSAVYHSDHKLSGNLKNKTAIFLNAAQQKLNYSRAQLNASQTQILNTSPHLSQNIKHQSSSSQNLSQIISLMAIIFIVYLIIVTYSSVTAQEIAAEKGTKIMEVIFSSTSPQKYFYGKILGIGGVIITQILVYILGGGAIYLGAKNISRVSDFLDQNQEIISNVFHNLLNANLAFLILGVVIYTILSAFSGVLVTRIEDASKAANLPVYLSLLAFFVAIPFMQNTDVLLVKILSFVPFFSSFFMPMRIIMGSVSTPEIWISLLILIASIILLSWWIARIYGGLTLQTEQGSFFKRLKHGFQYSK